MMRKTLISLACIVTTSIGFGSIATGLFIYEVFDSNGVVSNDAYTRIFNEYDINRGYSSTDVPVCNVVNGGITITSPNIIDADLYEAKTYRLFISPYRVSQLKYRNADINIYRVAMKEFETGKSSEKIQFNILSDGLDKSQIYYGFILPINNDYKIGTPSGEFCFQLDKNICVWNEDCDKISLQKTTTKEEKHQEEQQILANLSDEFIDAYNFAYKNGITTVNKVEKADMNGGLTRIAMAKMLSKYAINVLGKTPDTSKIPKFGDVSLELDANYDNGVTLAYQLGIMGVGVDKFRPFDSVTRGEFGTALSRMLYGLKDGNPYYVTHLKKLKEKGIITNDNPKIKEKRGYVMIMLMRSSK